MTLRNCIDYSRIEIRSVCVQGRCPQGLDAKHPRKVHDFVPEKFCPLAFHTLYPYLVAFTQKARLGWLRDRHAVEAQCPNPYCAVVMRISGNFSKKGAVDINVIGMKEPCPYGMRQGMDYADMRFPKGTCGKAFDSVMPYLNELAKGKNDGPLGVLRAVCGGCRTPDTDPARVVFEMREAQQ